jgi:hypothetical protein
MFDIRKDELRADDDIIDVPDIDDQPQVDFHHNQASFEQLVRADEHLGRLGAKRGRVPV